MNTNIETEKLLGPDRVMDVRPIPCSVKHGLIIRTWLEMSVGDHFILLNDHDPVPLYYSTTSLRRNGRARSRGNIWSKARKNSA